MDALVALSGRGGQRFSRIMHGRAFDHHDFELRNPLPLSHLTLPSRRRRSWHLPCDLTRPESVPGVFIQL